MNPEPLASKRLPVIHIKPGWAASLALFITIFLIYLFTLAPGVYGFDSAEFATGVYTQGVIHPPGFPLYLLLGKLFSLLPIRDLAYRLNLMSAVFAALAAVLLFQLLHHIVKSRFTAWIAAFLLAVSNYYWQMALVTEVYTVFLALLVLDLLWVMLWRKTGSARYLLLFSFFYGLTLTTHTSGILYAPAFTCLILFSPAWKKPCWKWVALMFPLFLTGLSLYAYLSIRAGAHPLLDYSQYYPKANLTTFSGLWWYISGRAYSFFAFGYSWSELPAQIVSFAGNLWRNNLGLGVILGLLGMITLSRKNFSLFSGLSLFFLANAFFYINYRVMDKDTMFLPAYLIWAIFVAVGLQSSEEQLKTLFARFDLPTWRPAFGNVSMVILVLLAVSLNWHWVDMSDSTGYSDFAIAIFTAAPQGAVILSPWSSAVVMEYYQIVEGMRPDLTIINQTRLEVAEYSGYWDQGLPHDEIMEILHTDQLANIQQIAKRQCVYAVEYDAELAQAFSFIPDGPAFRLLANDP